MKKKIANSYFNDELFQIENDKLEAQLERKRESKDWYQMSKANQKFHHPLKIFNKIKVIPKKELKRIEKEKKEKRREQRKKTNKYRFKKKGKKGRVS